MSKALNLKPIGAILAFAGSIDVQYEQAFAALTLHAGYILKDGNKRNLSDTLDVLTDLANWANQPEGTPAKRKAAAAQAARVLAVMQGAYTAAVTQHAAQPLDAAAAQVRAAELSAAASAAYDAECERAGVAETAASNERKAKAAATKAAKDKAAKAAERAAKAAQPQVQPLTLADAVGFLRAALSAGDVTAGLHLESLIADFCTFADAAPVAGDIVGEAREVAQPLALQH